MSATKRGQSHVTSVENSNRGKADAISRAKMKKWFEKWQAEKAKRKEKNLPAVVDYRDVTYVSLIHPTNCA